MNTSSGAEFSIKNAPPRAATTEPAAMAGNIDPTAGPVKPWYPREAKGEPWRSETPNTTGSTGWGWRSWSAREVTPGELLEEAIARAERVNPRINAIVTPLYDQARRDAGRRCRRPTPGRFAACRCCSRISTRRSPACR